MRMVYVTRGAYRGHVLQMDDDVANASIADQWGLQADTFGVEGIDTNIPDGWNTSAADLPQSLIDFETAAMSVGPVNPPGPAPVLTSLSPNTAEVGAPDVTMSAIGENFTAESRIVFGGGEENTTFVSATEVTTLVEPSTASGAATVPVYVKTGDQQSGSLDFTFTEPAEPEA